MIKGKGKGKGKWGFSWNGRKRRGSFLLKEGRERRRDHAIYYVLKSSGW